MIILRYVDYISIKICFLPKLSYLQKSFCPNLPLKMTLLSSSTHRCTKKIQLECSALQLQPHAFLLHRDMPTSAPEARLLVRELNPHPQCPDHYWDLSYYPMCPRSLLTKKHDQESHLPPNNKIYECMGSFLTTHLPSPMPMKARTCPCSDPSHLTAHDSCHRPCCPAETVLTKPHMEQPASGAF